MMGRRRGGMSLGRVAKKAAVATVVSRVVNNAMDNRMPQTGMNNQFGNGMQNNQNQMNNQNTMMNSCTSCGSNNPANAKFCLNCGTGFATASAAQAATPLSNCPGCKASLAGINGNFCPYCRTAINN